MAVIIPPGYAQVSLIWSTPNFDSGGGATVFGVGSTDPPFVPMADVAAGVAGVTSSLLVPEMDNSITLERVVAVDATTRAEAVAGAVGSSTRDLPPPNVATLVSLGTESRGRRARGRMYLFGLVNEPQINEAGFYDGGTTAVVQTVIDDWIDGMVTVLGHPLVILQGDDGISPPLDPPPPVTSWTVSPKVATQRRRLRR